MTCILRKLKKGIDDSNLPFISNGNVVSNVNGSSLAWIYGYYASVGSGGLNTPSNNYYICFQQDVRIKVSAGCSVTLSDSNYSFMVNVIDEDGNPIFLYEHRANTNEFVFDETHIPDYGYVRVSIRRVDSATIEQDEIENIVSSLSILKLYEE